LVPECSGTRSSSIGSWPSPAGSRRSVMLSSYQK
jgi:hypothetical protein